DLYAGEPRGFQFQRGRGAGLTSARHGGQGDGNSRNRLIESNPESLAVPASRGNHALPRTLAQAASFGRI
ncbi:MAG: hypothetical protein ACYC5T_02915, partial [Thiobacillus sp.]